MFAPDRSAPFRSVPGPFSSGYLPCSLLVKRHTSDYSAASRCSPRSGPVPRFHRGPAALGVQIRLVAECDAVSDCGAHVARRCERVVQDATDVESGVGEGGIEVLEEVAFVGQAADRADGVKGV